MKQPVLVLLLALAIPFSQAVAVKTGGDQSPYDFDGTYHTTVPTNEIGNWSMGWGSGGGTGWDYVGATGAASAVYLGNGWVLTAAHVNLDSIFTLGGTVYQRVANSEITSIVTTNGTNGIADLTLFRIASEPNLPPLTIATTTNPGSSVVMLGFGGGHGETWGLNTINPEGTLVDAGSWWSDDFSVTYSPITDANLVLGDSGGGDFTYNPDSRQWELTGINEAVDTISTDATYGDSYMIDLSEYAPQINAITGVPEPETWLLFGAGALLLYARSRLTRFRCG